MNAYDVIVIGSGPGGYVTAIRSAQLGFKTAIVEREHLGGICLNWGCIPTKALLRSSEMIHYAHHFQEYGLTLNGSIVPDIKAMVARSRKISAQLNTGIGFLMKKNKIDIIWGTAQFKDPKTIEVSEYSAVRQPQNPKPNHIKNTGTYTAKHFIIATGARPKILPGIEPDQELIWTFFDALLPKDIPESLLIVGSGAIGMEFASFYNSLGTKVTVIEMMPDIMPVEDIEISSFVKNQMEKRGVSFLTETKILSLKKQEKKVTLILEQQGKEVIFVTNHVMSAVGVQGNIENLGLENIGVTTDKNCILIDGYGKTNVPGVYAIGDVAGVPMLAHKAEHEGVLCIEKIAGLSNLHPLNRKTIPACTYTNPQVASVGLSEKEALKNGIDVRVGRFFFSASGKAIALGDDQGIIKTIFHSKTGQLLGVHMAGAEVTELIHSCVLAMNLETTEEELIHSIFPHPTLSEMIKESTLNAWGRGLNA